MEVNSELSLLANTVITTYFAHFYCLFVFHDNVNKKFAYTGTIPSINYNIYNISDKTNFEIGNNKCEGIIIASSNPKMVFQKVEHKIKTAKVQRYNNRKYLVLLPQIDSEEELSNLFNTTELYYVNNFLVVRTARENPAKCGNLRVGCTKENVEYEFLTNRYGGRGNNLDKVLLDKWFSSNKSYLFNNVLYPDKLSNQEGRPFRLATLHYPPFHIVENPAENSIGTETNFAKEYAKRHNMSVEYVIDEVGQWGNIFDNWTGVGLLGNTAMDNADIAFAAAYMDWFQVYYFLDFSYQAIRSGVYLLVPEPILAGGWTVPLFSFSTNMWIATFISFVCTILLLFLVTLYTRRDFRLEGLKIPKKLNSYINILELALFESSALFLLQSTSEMALMKRVYRYLFPIFIFTVLLTSAYSSGLASSLTIPRYSEAIKTVKDLEDRRLHWGGTDRAWLLAISNAEEEKYKRLLSSFVVAPAQKLEKLSYTRTFGFPLERLTGGYFCVPLYIKQKAILHLRPMAEFIYWSYCVFMLRKSTIILPTFNRLLLRLLEAGINFGWETKVVLFHTNGRIQQIIRYYYYHGEDIEIVRLRWIHVQGAFGILAIGYAIGFLCFFIEHVVHKFKTQRTFKH